MTTTSPATADDLDEWATRVIQKIRDKTVRQVEEQLTLALRENQRLRMENELFRQRIQHLNTAISHAPRNS